MSFAETDEEREARYTDQMEGDGKRILELEGELREAIAMVKRLGGNVKELTTCLEEATFKVARLESKLVQAGEGFPS